MLEQPIVAIFIGKSGCGKGTQADLLERYLEEINPERSVFHLETGDKFRELIAGRSYTSKLAKAIMEKGELEPSFLAVHIWAHILIDSYKGNQHVIIDGTPRAFEEVSALDSTLEFYGWKPHVIFMNVTDDWARTRLGERKRADDLEKSDVDNRLNWFQERVMPVIEYLRTSKGYTFHEINGEQSIEEVHREIRSKLNL